MQTTKKKKRKPGTPEIVLTDAQISQIEIMAGLGLTRPQIAAILGLSERSLYNKKDLDQRVTEAMARGDAKAASQVTQTLYRMATSGECPAATFFWLKTRLGWRDNTPVAAPDDLKPLRIFRTSIQPDGTLLQQIIEDDRAKSHTIDADAKPVLQ